MSIHRLRRKKTESELVTDQPGFTVFIIGTVMALVCGLLFRGFFSSDKIRGQVADAASRVHKNLKIDFASAELSLSKNSLPRIAVIIRDISMISNERCWMSPELKIDEILLPISLKNLISGQAAINEIIAGKVELKLNGEWKFCQADENVGKQALAPESTQKFVSLVQTGSTMSGQVSQDIHELKIDEFKLTHNSFGDIPTSLSNVVLSLKSTQPKVVLLKAQSYFFNEIQQRDYSSKAEINIEYNEFPERKLQTHVLGQFREGHFTIQMQNRLEDGQYNVELDLRHLPLSKIFSTLQGFGLMKELNPKQAWLSLKGRSRGFLDKIQSENFEIKDLKLEGDIGELNTELIEFSQLNPLKIKPFLMNAEQLDLGKVLSFYNKASVSPTLGDLGKFSGRVEVFDVEEFRFFGFHRGLEFVFSSLGSRELQKINQMSLDASLKKKKWNLKLNRFELEQGHLEGELALSADRNFHKLEVKAKIDNISLSPAVQRLVTQGGSFAPFSGNLNFIWEEGVLQKMLGAMSSDEAVINSIKFENLNFLFEAGKEFPYIMKTKFQNVMVPEALLNESFLSRILKPNWLVNGGLHLNRVSGAMGFARNHSAEWKGFQASLTGGVEKISSEGAWDAEGLLRGALSIKSLQGNMKLKIKGTRDQPAIEEVGDSSNVRVESTAD